VFGLNFRELLPNIVREELDQIVASVQAAWGRQHAQDGTHKALTADSLTTPSVWTSRLSLEASTNTAAIESSGGFEVIKVVLPASPTAIVNVLPSETDDVTLWALSTVGRQDGEMVILRAAYDFGATHFGFLIRSNSSATTPADAAKFLIFGDGAGTNYDALTVGVGESVVLRLEHCSPTQTSSAARYWRVLGKLSIA
jgi:hypothetical protein